MKKKADASNKTEKFLEHKRLMKKLTDEKSGAECYMLYARALNIAWGGNSEYWTWNCYKETDKENFEVAKLREVCWLDVSGKLKMSELSPGIVYDIFYVVKLTKGASAGWELPITLKLSLPDGRDLCRQLSLLMKPRGEWIELNVGSFQTVKGKTGEVCFGLCEHRGHWKTGLIIKGAIIRARN